MTLNQMRFDEMAHEFRIFTMINKIKGNTVINV